MNLYSSGWDGGGHDRYGSSIAQSNDFFGESYLNWHLGVVINNLWDRIFNRVVGLEERVQRPKKWMDNKKIKV